MFIYLLDKDGNALMPTERAGKVRRMLRDGRAVIASHKPFTVRLTYDSASYTQSVSLGVDAGSKTVGLSATTKDRELYSAEVGLRTDIVANLAARREARRTRRGKRSMRYRAPRFDNRRRPDGWLAPSTKQKVRSHVRAVQDTCRFLPVTEVTIEVAQFDTQWIKNPGLTGTDYQHGPQYGFRNVREYVLARDGHKCQCCHGRTKDKVLNVHHIESRKTGGDSPDNLVTLCETCHKAYHDGKAELNLERQSAPLRDAAFMSVMRWTTYGRLKDILDVPVKLTYGYVTKSRRIEASLEKGHAVDARCISGNATAVPSGVTLVLKRLRRHNRKVMKSNMLKGGRWKRNQAPREVTGFRLFDSVLYHDVPAYVSGRRSSGFFTVKDGEGKTLSASVSCKSLGLIRHNNTHVVFVRRNGSRSNSSPA